MGYRFQMPINNLPLILTCDSEGMVAISPTQKIVKNIIQDFGVPDKLYTVFSEMGATIEGIEYNYNTLYKLVDAENLRKCHPVSSPANSNRPFRTW